MWCGTGKVTVWCCPDASALESAPWRETELSQRVDQQLWSALEDRNPSSLPGHNVQNCKEDDEGPHRHQEPWENTCDHSDTEEHQDDILDEHLSLERQAHINWGNHKGTRVRHWGSTNRENGTKNFTELHRGSPKSLSEIGVLPFKQSHQRKI